MSTLFFAARRAAADVVEWSERMVNAVAAGVGKTSFCLTVVVANGYRQSTIASDLSRGSEGRKPLTDVVLAQGDGEEEAIEGGDGSQEEEPADVLFWGCHQPEVVHRGHSSNEKGSETACRGSGSLDGAVFLGTEVAAAQVGGQRLRKGLQNGEAAGEKRKTKWTLSRWVLVQSFGSGNEGVPEDGTEKGGTESKAWQDR
jgi:hypothetical protein